MEKASKDFRKAVKCLRFLLHSHCKPAGCACRSASSPARSPVFSRSDASSMLGASRLSSPTEEAGQPVKLRNEGHLLSPLQGESTAKRQLWEQQANKRAPAPFFQQPQSATTKLLSCPMAQQLGRLPTHPITLDLWRQARAVQLLPSGPCLVPLILATAPVGTATPCPCIAATASHLSPGSGCKH